ncbi:MAG: enoyl-CoA hydratase/isomerase family protein [Chloroflexota bacterium]
MLVITDGDSEVLFTVHQGLALITLNRPRAINALTHAMVLQIDKALAGWASDAHIRAVMIRGAGDRGLCAGGDLRPMYADATTGGTAAFTFWADEYRLNARIARYPKPYIAIMDGLVMGGGVGLSAHGSVRVVTERSRIGMPEVGIGLFPDVGGTYLLSRAPGQLGLHVALTGAPISAADALLCGLADSYVPSDYLGDLFRALQEEAPGTAIASHAVTPPASQLQGQRAWIDQCYDADSVEEILARLEAYGGEAALAASVIQQKSPTSLKVTLRAIRSAERMPNLETVLDQEYRLARASLHAHDLAEGIRAQIIEKDRNPRWFPATLAEVTDEAVDAYFAPLGDAELGLASGANRA